MLTMVCGKVRWGGMTGMFTGGVVFGDGRDGEWWDNLQGLVVDLVTVSTC